mmetsp:Transcript_30955/g.69712  ORF Transcript_30955/g.69712 Transcript_30955/m.69712 type:complete len:460 (-) Transcript_30955:441-1820(-)
MATPVSARSASPSLAATASAKRQSSSSLQTTARSTLTETNHADGHPQPAAVAWPLQSATPLTSSWCTPCTARQQAPGPLLWRGQTCIRAGKAQSSWRASTKAAARCDSSKAKADAVTLPRVPQSAKAALAMAPPPCMGLRSSQLRGDQVPLTPTGEEPTATAVAARTLAPVSSRRIPDPTLPPVDFIEALLDGVRGPSPMSKDGTRARAATAFGRRGDVLAAPPKEEAQRGGTDLLAVCVGDVGAAFPDCGAAATAADTGPSGVAPQRRVCWAAEAGVAGVLGVSGGGPGVGGAAGTAGALATSAESQAATVTAELGWLGGVFGSCADAWAAATSWGEVAGHAMRTSFLSTPCQSGGTGALRGGVLSSSSCWPLRVSTTEGSPPSGSSPAAGEAGADPITRTPDVATTPSPRGVAAELLAALGPSASPSMRISVGPGKIPPKPPESRGLQGALRPKLVP